MVPIRLAKQSAGIDDPVHELAEVLKRAVPLAALVNSGQHTDDDRDRLRELVGRANYVALAVDLSQMKSIYTPCCCDARSDPPYAERTAASVR